MTRGEIALTVLAVAAGAMLPMQALVNGRLGGALGSPLWASMLQNLVGALAMGSLILMSRTAAPSGGQLASAPVWAWAGGMLGVVFVIGALLAAPRLGATRAFTAVIVGQLICSLLLDQFGVLHPRRPATLETVGGVLLLAAGAALVLRRP